MTHKALLYLRSTGQVVGGVQSSSPEDLARYDEDPDLGLIPDPDGEDHWSDLEVDLTASEEDRRAGLATRKKSNA